CCLAELIGVDHVDAHGVDDVGEPVAILEATVVDTLRSGAVCKRVWDISSKSKIPSQRVIAPGLDTSALLVVAVVKAKARPVRLGTPPGMFVGVRGSKPIRVQNFDQISLLGVLVSRGFQYGVPAANPEEVNSAARMGDDLHLSTHGIDDTVKGGTAILK